MNSSSNSSVYVAPNVNGNYGLLAAGCAMIVINFIVAFTIAYQKALRTEKVFIILFGLAVINALDGIPAAAGAIYQLRLLLIGPPELTELFTPAECMTRLHVWMFAFTDPAQSLMLLMVSLDRLFSVTAPLRYLSLGRRYAHALVGFVFLYSLVSAIAAWIYPLTYSGPAFISALCINRLAYGPFQTYLNVIRIAYGYSSVVLYALVLIVFRSKVVKAVPTTSDARATQVNDRQRRLTTTLGVQSLSNLLLFIVPMAVATNASISVNLIIWLFMFSNSNAIVNLFIYFWRLKEFRHALVCTICGCRRLPSDMSLWFVNGNAVSNNAFRRIRATSMQAKNASQ